MNLCKCGCGAQIANGKSFVSGHNGRGLRKPRVERPCKQCGTLFSGTAAAMKKRVFCSLTCRNAHNASLTGPAHPSYTSLTLPCSICGKTFTTQPARLKDSQVYCSMECGREGRRRKISGVARKTRPYGKQKAKVRDGFACRICGFDLVVHAHHIKHRKDGGTNEISNLITLCPNHHALAHAGVLSEQEMLAAISAEPPQAEKLRVAAKLSVNYRAGKLLV